MRHDNISIVEKRVPDLNTLKKTPNQSQGYVKGKIFFCRESMLIPGFFMSIFLYPFLEGICNFLYEQYVLQLMLTYQLYIHSTELTETKKDAP